MRAKAQFCFLVSAAVCCLNHGLAAFGADALEGHVKQNTRITRPVPPGLDGETARSTVVSDDSFNLSAGSNSSQAASELLPGKVEEMVLPAAASRTAITGGIASRSPSTGVTSRPLAGSADAERMNGGTGGGHAQGGIVDDYNAKKPLQGSVTFRFCYYDLGDGVECTWEGLRDALYLQGRGVDIALMLDRGGVRLANKHNVHEYQLHRGSTERLVKNQAMLREFIDKGGKVYCSERWARQFGLYGGSYPALTQGVELLGDEEMAELLVDRSGRIVEY